MRDNYIPTIKELEEMAETDIREVDSDDLVDIEDIDINTNLSEEERIEDYLEQVKNPYCYKDNGVIVKIGFAGSKSLEECIAEYIVLEK